MFGLQKPVTKNDSRCYLESDILCFHLLMKLDNSNEQYLSLLVFNFFSILLMLCKVDEIIGLWKKPEMKPLKRNHLRTIKRTSLWCCLEMILFKGVHETAKSQRPRDLSISDYPDFCVRLLLTQCIMHDKNHVLWNYQFSFHVNLLMLWHWDENWKIDLQSSTYLKKIH
mgnify:CR=1 FL=1